MAPPNKKCSRIQLRQLEMTHSTAMLTWPCYVSRVTRTLFFSSGNSSTNKNTRRIFFSSRVVVGRPCAVTTGSQWAMNTTVTSHSSEVDDLDCSRFTFNAYVLVFGFMCVFGLVGNGLSWVVLSRERHNSGRVATFLLQTMAVIDNLFLITAGISHITSAVLLYVDSSSTSSDVGFVRFPWWRAIFTCSVYCVDI